MKPLKSLKPLPLFIRRSLRPNRFIPVWLFTSVLVSILLYSCTSPLNMMNGGRMGQAQPVATSSQNGNATMAQQQTFASNGEQIYFTGTSDRRTNITPTEVPYSNGMTGNGGMMGNGNGTQRGVPGNGGMMGNGFGNDFLTCASCHGSDGVVVNIR